MLLYTFNSLLFLVFFLSLIYQTHLNFFFFKQDATKKTFIMKHLFITIGLLFLVIPVFSQDITGDWMGEITVGGGTLEIAYHIQKNATGYQAAMDIIKQGLSGAKADKATFVNDSIYLQFATFKIEYKGQLTNENEVKGKLISNGHAIDLNLKKGTIVLNRPQEPKPPFSYYTEEVTFTSTDGIKLAGTLSLPAKTGKYPMVIIVSGSGPQNRDGEVFGHKPYLLLADYLTKNGIGVFRFDERRQGASGGDFETITIDTSADDVEAAMTYLKSRKDITLTKMGLIGHSIGGAVGPVVAVETGKIDFLVLMAGPGVNGDKLMMSQKAALERLMGLNEMQIAQGRDIIKGAYDIITGTQLEATKLKDSLNSFYLKKYGSMIPEAQRTMIAEQLTAHEVLSLVRYKPATFLEKVKCPVLAINGSKDFQVSATENLPAIKAALEKGGNKNVKTVELEGLNHLFQECTTGAKSEYPEIEQTMSPAVLELITGWIKEVVK